MYCIIKCTVQGKQARVKNARFASSCTVVTYKRKYASPVLNVLKIRSVSSIIHHSETVYTYCNRI